MDKDNIPNWNNPPKETDFSKIIQGLIDKIRYGDEGELKIGDTFKDGDEVEWVIFKVLGRINDINIPSDALENDFKQYLGGGSDHKTIKYKGFYVIVTKK